MNFIDLFGSDGMNAQKWNPKMKKYAPYELPEGASIYEDDMEVIVSCAQCGREMRFGDGYTSKQIHTKYGMGYAICEKCYEQEREEERENEE